MIGPQNCGAREPAGPLDIPHKCASLIDHSGTDHVCRCGFAWPVDASHSAGAHMNIPGFDDHLDDYGSPGVEEEMFCGDEWDHEPHEWSNFGTYECAGYASHSLPLD